MQFDYFYITQVNATIDIDDVGNCCLLARNDIGLEYYLFTKTEYGKTEIITVGPLFMDEDELFPETVNLQYTTFDYNMKKISGIIDKFLKNPKACITYVELIELKQFRDRFPKFVDIIK